MPDVLVTGLGPVSSIGIGAGEFTAGLRAGRSGVSEITSFDASGFPYRRAGEVTAFEAGELLDRLVPEEWGRTSSLAAAAARLAVTDAGWDPAGHEPGRAGAVVGTTSGESVVMETVTRQIIDDGFAGMTPDVVGKLPAGRLAHGVSAELGLTGESMTLATACSAANYAIGYAYDLVASGRADVMLAGGADSVCRWAHAGFHRLGALAADVCTPFDRDRAGILTGEGGAMLVLESREHAEARGARPYAELLGYGLNCDAKHPVAPDPASIAECMRMAQRNAAVKPAAIDYICAHGTGTPANDAAEARAIFEVFGPEPPPVSSIKSMLGHTMGAASGFGAIAVSLAIAEGFLPPTINWSTRDPELGDLDPIPNTARETPVRVAQNNGFAFGGNNAITVFGALT